MIYFEVSISWGDNKNLHRGWRLNWQSQHNLGLVDVYLSAGLGICFLCRREVMSPIILPPFCWSSPKIDHQPQQHWLSTAKVCLHLHGTCGLWAEAVGLLEALLVPWRSLDSINLKRVHPCPTSFYYSSNHTWCRHQLLFMPYLMKSRVIIDTSMPLYFSIWTWDLPSYWNTVIRIMRSHTHKPEHWDLSALTLSLPSSDCFSLSHEL